MPGPAPKPSVLKKLAGNPGKRPLNQHEPVLPIHLPPAPKWLSAEARAEYRRVGKLLVRMRVMTDADRAALLAYAVAYARWVEAEQAMAMPDFCMVQTTDKGYQHASPWLQVSNQAVKQMRTFMSEFGLTPASRSRVEAQEDPDGEFSLAELLFSTVSDGRG